MKMKCTNLRYNLLSAFVFLTFVFILLAGSVLAANFDKKIFRDSDSAGKKDLSQEKIKKRYIIVYKNKIENKDIDDLRERKGEIRKRYKILSAVAVEIDEQEIEEIKLDRDVKSVYEDIQMHVFLDESMPQINADQVHAIGVNGAGVKVCIVDTGIDNSHPALPLSVIEHDIVNNDNDANDDNGHGTHVAGIVFSSNSTYKGVAYGAELIDVKVMDATGSGWSSDVITGIDTCVAEGADVISLSLGGGLYTSACDSDPTAQAANNAVEQGVVVFAASGNDGYINAISSPACGSDVIAIGAVDDADGRTPYSNEGTELDFVAPGGISGNAIMSTLAGGGFGGKMGTSMATPHGAGTAALLLEVNSAFAPSDIKNILINSAVDLGNSGFDTIYGYGRIDAFAAYEEAGGSGSGGGSGNESYVEILSDNFNDGTVDANLWNANNANENAGCGAQSAPNALYFTGSGNRYTSTQELDVSNGGKISFYLKFGTGSLSSGCENADNGEDAVLEYSTNNGNSWTNIQTYDTEAYSSFSFIMEQIPANAKTTGTIFRWRQLGHSGSNWDNWAIDDVIIEAVVFQQSCSVDADCSDGLFCNGIETCVSGICASGILADCSTLNDQCNTGFCEEESDSCITAFDNEGLVCDDNLFCTVGEVCAAGVCGSSTARFCDDENTCTTDSCNEEINTCEFIEIPQCVNEIKCWSSDFEFLRRSASDARKFCKCAVDVYTYESYRRISGRANAYYYSDSGNNENWQTRLWSNYQRPIYEVECINNQWYPTNEDYFFSG